MSDATLTTAALERIKISRGYLQAFLGDLQPADWFWRPNEGVTHIAWQVGHSAAAQYALALLRIRGEDPDDESLIPQAFRANFGKGSTPQTSADEQAAVDRIVSVFNRVYDKVLETIPSFSDEDLDVPLDQPHPVFKTKLGSLQFCSQHEMLHTGQIGLLRRLMGKDPLR